MRDFKGLTVWRRAHRLTLDVYRTSESFPRRELFGLTEQVRRASVSIAANIAEGCGRDSQRDFSRFLQLSIGSANELEYHLLLACDLGYLPREAHLELDSQLAEVRRMLSSLFRKARSDSSFG